MKKCYLFLLVLTTVIIFVSCGNDSKEEVYDGNPRVSQMKAICELATMECYYHNVAKYKKEDVTGWWLWEKDRVFWVEYSGIVTLGIDASRLQMEVKDDTVTIALPKAQVLGSKVDAESLTEDSFYVADDSATVDAESQTEAYKAAEHTMLEQAAKDTALLANARQRAQVLLEDYVINIGNVVGKQYKIVWKSLEEEVEE